MGPRAVLQDSAAVPCVDSWLPGTEGSALPAPTPLFWVWKCCDPRGAVLSAAQGLFGRVVGCVGPLQSSP